MQPAHHTMFPAPLHRAHCTHPALHSHPTVPCAPHCTPYPPNLPPNTVCSAPHTYDTLNPELCTVYHTVLSASCNIQTALWTLKHGFCGLNAVSLPWVLYPAPSTLQLCCRQFSYCPDKEVSTAPAASRRVRVRGSVCCPLVSHSLKENFDPA